MTTPADTLVTKYPTRIAQLEGPVLDYMKRISKKLPFNGTEQDLYMAVFHPTSRRADPGAPFDDYRVARDNPGIETPGDYIRLVNNHKNTATLTPEEWTALKNTAKKLNVPSDSLYRLINFESGWDPKAKNPTSGARGLIQFMPSTASWLGFSAGGGVMVLLAVAAAVYFFLRR